LGYTDPDAERLAAEMERRRTQGVVGDWEVVSTGPKPSTSTQLEEDISTKDESDTLASQLNNAEESSGVKREAETPLEDDGRSFKLRKKTLGTGLGEIYDPGMLSIKVKKNEESTRSYGSSAAPQPSKVPEAESSSSSLPKWTPVQLKRPNDTPVKEEESQLGVKLESGSAVPRDDALNQPTASKCAKIQWSTPQQSVKSEEIDFSAPSQPSLPTETFQDQTQVESKPDFTKEESIDPTLSDPGKGMFRKRKIPVKGGTRR
jgi:WW domain-binding protein 4